jgi:hypothetical protein
MAARNPANPNDTLGATENVKPVRRPDQPTIAPGGNRVTAAGWRSIATLGSVDRRAANRAQPLGAPVEAA